MENKNKYSALNKWRIASKRSF